MTEPSLVPPECKCGGNVYATGMCAKCIFEYSMLEEKVYQDIRDAKEANLKIYADMIKGKIESVSQ